MANAAIVGAGSRRRIVVFTDLLLARLDDDEVAAVFAHEAAHAQRRHLSRYAALGLLAPDRRSLSLFVTSGLAPGEVERIGPPPRGHGILGLLIRDARPLRLPDLTRHPDSAGFPPGHPPMHSFLGTPVIGTNEVLGNLYLTEKLGGGYFTDEDEYLTVLLAAMAAAAMENARHHEESARHVADVESLP